VADPTTAPRPAERTTRRHCRIAVSADDLAAHFAVRRAVFCTEQAIFTTSDRDERDDDPATLAVIGLAGATVGGAVRLYPLDGDGLWKGDRLAVLPAYRRGLLGASLVRFAVRSAGDLGGARMVAMIQAPNLHFFEWLGWEADGREREYRGVPHVPVTIGLSRQRGR
jgi:putative N-acetyltransferase (TIGR04045 family)